MLTRPSATRSFDGCTSKIDGGATMARSKPSHLAYVPCQPCQPRWPRETESDVTVTPELAADEFDWRIKLVDTLYKTTDAEKGGTKRSRPS